MLASDARWTALALELKPHPSGTGGLELRAVVASSGHHSNALQLVDGEP